MAKNNSQNLNTAENDPLWYKDAVIYEVHVKTFCDTNGDGIGDFKGLTEKLDYLEDLGVTAVWLLPFYPSPLKDDGYDISDYFNVHPNYGTLRDFRHFLNEAHMRGMKVITELVLNHTSDKHQWFQDARKARPGSSRRNFYVWSDTTEKYKEARIIFKDFETSNWTWDPVAGAYFWHRFYSHQPDLNFDNPDVRKAVLKVVDYWLDMGVDGLRLDAVPYIFEREGTSCENLSETYEYLRTLRKYIDNKYTGKMLLAEANQWPEDAAAYFGTGDSCHMVFHFPLMPRMFMAIQMEDRFPLINILDQTPVIPDTCQWVIFLRNHDELTLEMVTDEERDYMYKVYARDSEMRINLGIRRRLAPLMGNDRRKMEIMKILLMSFTGTPVIYYGDEIAMGDNYYLGDRDGVRTPMQWSAQRNAAFSHANPQKLYLPVIVDAEYHYEAVNVENQQHNPSSFLWWMKRLIIVRKRYKAMSRGSIEFIESENNKIIAFIRQYKEEIVLIVANLSRLAQFVELNLSKYASMIPEEVFGHNEFPKIKEQPYAFTLGSYDYFWFVLKKENIGAIDTHAYKVQSLEISGDYEHIFHGKTAIHEKALRLLENKILPSYLSVCRWFAGKARKIQDVEIYENVPFTAGKPAVHILLLRVSYLAGLPETYMLSVSFACTDDAKKIATEYPHAVIASIKAENGECIMYDAVYNEEFRHSLLLFIMKRKAVSGINGEITSFYERRAKNRQENPEDIRSSQVLKADQSNTSIVYGKKLILKLYRKVEEGLNPDIELTRFLTDTRKGPAQPFKNIPSFEGFIGYKRRKSEELTHLGSLHRYVANEGDAWAFSQDVITRYFERILSLRPSSGDIPGIPSCLPDISYDKIPEMMFDLIGTSCIESMRRLGTTTANFHMALASRTDNPDFAPEPFTPLYQRSLYQSMQNLAKRTFGLLAKNLKKLPDKYKEDITEAVSYEKEVIKTLKVLTEMKISAMRIRVHGDYHLGQVLRTGNDFTIIDFEGEPSRSMTERRLKSSPLKDIAGMIRSMHYAPYSAALSSKIFPPKDTQDIFRWANLWYCYVSGFFLHSYIDTAKGSSFIPETRKELESLLRIYLLEKAVYELGYELNNRPDWVIIPVRGLKFILNV